MLEINAESSAPNPQVKVSSCKIITLLHFSLICKWFLYRGINVLKSTISKEISGFFLQILRQCELLNRK